MSALPIGFGSTSSWQYQLILAIQNFDPPLVHSIAKWLTYAGMEEFYVFLLPVLFWSIHRRRGLLVAYTFLLSMYTNAWLKVFLHMPRPIGMPGIRSSLVSTAPGYSMPSGHAQGSTTVWLTLAMWVKQPIFWLFAVLLAVGIGLSRLWLGLHWPLDVLAGWGLGAVFAFASWFVGNAWQVVSYPARLLTAILLPICLVFFHNDPVSLTYASLLFGIGVGDVWEQRFFHLQMERGWWRRLCTAVIGLAGVLLLYRYVPWPDGNWAVFFKGTSVGMFTTLIAPVLFWQCGLYKSTMPPTNDDGSGGVPIL